MPSMKCHECNKIKRCRMHLEVVRDSVSETYPAGRTTTVYLCRPCERELGYDKQAEPEQAEFDFSALNDYDPRNIITGEIDS